MLRENVTVDIFSREYIDDECIETKGTYHGKCHLKNKKIYISYKEKIEGVEEPVDTLITLDENFIQISRLGEVRSSMRFVCKEDTKCQYKTVAGIIDLIIHTQKYVTILGEGSMDIYLDYSLEMNGVKGGYHEVIINLT